MQAIHEYVIDNGYDGELFHQEVPSDVLKVMLDSFEGPVIKLPNKFMDLRREAAAVRQAADLPPRKARRWTDITGITLHQTATVLGERPRLKLGIHYVGTREGTIHYLNSHNVKVPQAQHLFNKHDVGIEMDGYYSGIGTDLKFFWKPKSRPDRRPMTPTADLIKSTRATVRWIVEDVERHGGKIEFIHAHRQTSKSRTSDPGQLLWQEVGIWAQKELGLSDGGIGYSVLTGNPIPEVWDPRCKGIPYR